MPFNITQGSTVEFTVGFVSSNGVVTVPSSATLTLVYTTSGGTLVSSVISMTLNGSFYVATWQSAQAAYGAVNYTITAPGQPTPTTGSLRLLD